jgi:hypothetical protein
MLFACEYCYGVELILGWIATGGVFLSAFWCWVKFLFKK